MSDFEKAFAQAREEGKTLFWWRGRQYTTERADGKPLEVVRDFDAERALRLEAERQAVELREQLKDTQTRYQKDLVLSRERWCYGNRADTKIAQLQAKLDTAMGLLREVKPIKDDLYSAVPYDWHLRQKAFLSTTSTGSKDNE